MTEYNAPGSPKTTIIIPHFNRVELLRETLDSVYAQTYSNWEVIVVDDQSDPDQWGAIQPYTDAGRVRVMQRETAPKGPSHCRNIGLENAHGDYVIFLDSDDLLAPWCLEERIRWMQGNTEYGFLVFSALFFENKPGDMPTLWNQLSNERSDLDRFLYSDPVWCVSSPMWRKSTLVELGGFNEQVLYGDDAELHIRGILAGMEYLKTDAPADCFIRARSSDKLTSSNNREALESRLIFLSRVRQLLERYDAGFRSKHIWDGACFAEGEYLLFTCDEAVHPLRRLCREMSELISVPRVQRWLMVFYFNTGIVLVNNGYLLLRLLRRAMMLLLPRVMFERPKSFGRLRVTQAEIDALRSRLQCFGSEMRGGGDCSRSD